MKYLIIILLIVCLYLPAQSKEIHSKIIYIEGEVTVLTFGNREITASVGTELNKGDIIVTGARSVCDIEFAPKTYSRIQENSKVEITSLFRVKKGLFFHNKHIKKINLKIHFGDILSKLKKLSFKEEFKVLTPVAVAAVRGTVFSTSYLNNDFNVSVIQGNVSVTNLTSHTVTIVPAGRKLSISSSGKTKKTNINRDEMSKISIKKTTKKKIRNRHLQKRRHVKTKITNPLNNTLNSNIIIRRPLEGTVYLRGKF